MRCDWQRPATNPGLGVLKQEEGAAANPHIPAFLMLAGS
jgi:hypothetical protein